MHLASAHIGLDFFFTDGIIAFSGYSTWSRPLKGASLAGFGEFLFSGNGRNIEVDGLGTSLAVCLFSITHLLLLREGKFSSMSTYYPAAAFSFCAILAGVFLLSSTHKSGFSCKVKSHIALGTQCLVWSDINGRYHI